MFIKHYDKPQKEGVFRLRDHKSVFGVLKKLVRGGGVKLKPDLLTEVKMTMDILGKLPKLPAPILTSIDSFSVAARWDSVIATPGNRVVYQLFQGMEALPNDNVLVCDLHIGSMHPSTCNVCMFL